MKTHKTVKALVIATSALFVMQGAAVAQTAPQYKERQQASNEARQDNSEAHVAAYKNRNVRATQQADYKAREANSEAHVAAYQNRYKKSADQKAYAAREAASRAHVAAYNNRKK